MTLAVAALAVAAIFMSSSAGLLSRFYDREREFRLTAESVLELTRARLARSTTLAIPDTGMVQLASGLQLRDADGTVLSRVSANVYAAVTGDTSVTGLPSVSLIAQVYDANGTRHVRRMDLRAESFSRYNLFIDGFEREQTFGPGIVTGRAHTNGVWRSRAGLATDQVYRDTVTAVGGFSGDGTFRDSLSGVARIAYPLDATYPRITALSNAANLTVTPVTGSGPGWVRGTRVEFVAFDADANGTIEVGEGYARIFDLAAGADTSRLRVSIDAKPWTDVSVQNQCGAFYLRGGRWQFFPVATHRAARARNIIEADGNEDFPAVSDDDMNAMDDSTFASTRVILSQSTARCFPAGSPYLMPTERLTNDRCRVTNTSSDVYPFGTAPLCTSLPGGTDTSFTAVSRTCGVTATGLCSGGTSSVLGGWREFGGTRIAGTAAGVRQTNELPFLWPLTAPSNAKSAGLMRITGDVFLSGRVRGALTVMVDGSPRIIEPLTQVNDPSSPDAPPCADQLGLIAAGDILVADNVLFRAKRVTGLPSTASFVRQLGGSRDIQIHAQLMSLGGTVGVENPFAPAILGGAVSCPDGAAANTAGGCFRLVGGAAMLRYSPLHAGGQTGVRWAGLFDRCSTSGRRPPLFPLTSRYALVRTIELAPIQANSPTKIRALLMRLKGQTL